jgi:hypothetical protein
MLLPILHHVLSVWAMNPELFFERVNVVEAYPYYPHQFL